MADPKAVTRALDTVQASAANLERIGQSQDDEFRRLLCDLAQEFRLLAAVIQTLYEIRVQHDSVAA